MSDRSSEETKLKARVHSAAERALSEQGQVSAFEVLLRIGWLPESRLDLWRTRRLEALEVGMQVNPAKLQAALDALTMWAEQRGLQPTVIDYVDRTPARTPLRFTVSGDPDLERRYRTHWMSPKLPEKKRERLEAKAAREPELVVIQALNEWKCHRCGGTGALLFMETGGPACLECAGLGALEFLPSGDTGLTRRAKAKSGKHAVVVRFSRTRKRYERQGLLLEPDAIRAAEKELGRPTRSESHDG